MSMDDLIAEAGLSDKACCREVKAGRSRRIRQTAEYSSTYSCTKVCQQLRRRPVTVTPPVALNGNL